MRFHNIFSFILEAVVRGIHVLCGVGPCCRFSPSCSAFAREAVKRYGIFRGFLLTIHRLLRCHPFGGWGYDPVPPRVE